jgi:malate dehydrogenase
VRQIAIVGAGDLGGAVARQAAAARIASQIILIDEAATVAQGKALDVMQASPVDGYTTALTGTGDDSAAMAADAIVIADRHSPAAEWQDDAGLQLLRRLAMSNERALIVCAGARQASMIDRAVHEARISATRLIGSAPEALRSAIAALAALEAQCSPVDISLTVVGRAPGHIIVPWDDASIAGRRATDVLSPPAITRLDGRLARLWPPGPFALASAATRFLVAAASRTPRTLCGIVGDSGSEAPRSTGMLPLVLDGRRVATVATPSLSGRDRVRLETALHR